MRTGCCSASVKPPKRRSILAEVAGRQGHPDFRTRLEPHNRIHNDGLPRIALKMATGSGKTVVMAMLIAWQTINKVYSPNDARLRQAVPRRHPWHHHSRPASGAAAQRPGQLLPRARTGAGRPVGRRCKRRRSVIMNYHQFLLQDRKEIQGVASNTRKILNVRQDGRPVRGDPRRDGRPCAPRLHGPRQGRDRGVQRRGSPLLPGQAARRRRRRRETIDKEDKDRNADARVWFKGLLAVKRKLGIKTIYDLSATPFYLNGSGYNEGFIFPWVVSDFSLMDAIESGIVKVPRLPVDDDSSSDHPDLPQHVGQIGDKLPKRKAKADSCTRVVAPFPPRWKARCAACIAATRRPFEQWENDTAAIRSRRRRCSSWSARTRWSRSWSTTGSPGATSSGPDGADRGSNRANWSC